MAQKWDCGATSSEKLLLLFAILLFNNRAFSLNELSSPHCLNASKPTVLRLLRQLEQAKTGMLIHEKKGRESWYRLDRNTSAAISLNPDAVRHLALCRDFLHSLLPEKLINETASVIAALQGMSDEGPLMAAESLTKGHIDYDEFAQIFQTLELAIKEERICRAVYQASRNQEAREHWIAPKNLAAYHETIYARCWLLENPKSAQRKYEDSLLLALQRFKSCELTEFSSASLPAIQNTVNGYFGLVKDEPFRAKIRFSRDVATYISERVWSERQKMEWQPDGSLLLTLMINNTEEGLSWIMGFGVNALVLKPEWFVKHVRKNLRKALGNYSGHGQSR